jgi:Ig-like domain from next to BRCA1 gene/Peptidase family M23
VRHLTPDENRGKRTVYVDAKDETGRRCWEPALRIGWTWEGRRSDVLAQPVPLYKPDTEPAGNVDLYWGQKVEAWIAGDGLPSDHVANLHTRHPDEEAASGEFWNSRGHHSFRVVFQRTRKGQEEGGSGGVVEPVSQPFRFEVWPSEYRVVTQEFGANPENYKPYNLPGHEGVDIRALPGTKVFCVAPGKVKIVHLDPRKEVHNYGIHVRVSHAGNYETTYAHLQSVAVRVDQQVAAGQLLGLADNTGNSKANHLHLTLKHYGETYGDCPGSLVDPTPFLEPLLAGLVGPARGVVQVRVAEKLGLNCNAPTDPTGGITPRVADPGLIADTDVRWVRVNFILRPFDSPTNPAWVATYRQFIQGLRGRGLKIYGLVGAEAAAGDPGNRFREELPKPADDPWIRDYARNFRQIVQTFRDDVEVFESFNEPNDWHGLQKAWVHPAWFAIILQKVYEAVRDLNVKLVSGPLLSTEDGNNAADYLPDVYRAGTDRFGWGRPGVPMPFDGVGYHPYVLRNPDKPKDQISARYREYMEVVRGVITKAEGALKPIYLSEIGFQNAPDRQAECMEVGVACALNDPSVALCFWYGMQDDAAQKYGLYGAAGLAPEHRKPVYGRFATVARDPRSVPAAVGPGQADRNARYAGEFDKVPDGTALAAGSRFSKTWRLVNTGGAPWGEGYRLLRVGGHSLGGPASVAAPATPPGGTADFTVQFAAPRGAGDYISTWQLVDPAGNRFGPPVWAKIRVKAAAIAPPALAPAALSLAAAVAGLPAPAELAPGQPERAAALGIIYTTYWLRALAALSAPDPQQALQDAANDALTQIREWME